MDDLLTAFVSELKTRIESTVHAAVKDALGKHEIENSPETEFDPWRLYKAEEAADVLGLDRATMYDIPETELPRCRVGPARGSTRWMGADLLAYARGLEPIDYEETLSNLRERLRQPHSQTPESVEEKDRVL